MSFIIYLWTVYDNSKTIIKITNLTKDIFQYLNLWWKNPEVLTSISKVYLLKENNSTTKEEYYEKISDKLQTQNPSFLKNKVIFTSKNSKNSFEIKIDKDIKHISVKTNNYSFFPFRNPYRLKFIKEDLSIISEVITNENKSTLINEMLICEIQLENIKNKNKIEFLFDGILIQSKDNKIYIKESQYKNYENIIRAVIIKWFKLIK